MLIAVFSDIHGNIIALQQCLDDIRKQGVDQIICLGDYVGYFPDYNEVLDEIQASVEKCLLGNHDAMLLDIIPIDAQRDVVYQINCNRKNVSQSNLAFLKKLLPFHTYSSGGKNLLFVHGSPFNPLTEYMGTTYDFSKLKSLEFDYLFCGHTHIPYVTKVGHLQIVNVGSCSMPRADGRLGSYALLDLRDGSIQVKEIKLDVPSIINRYTGKVHPTVLELLNRRANA